MSKITQKVFEFEQIEGASDNKIGRSQEKLQGEHLLHARGLKTDHDEANRSVDVALRNDKPSDGPLVRLKLIMNKLRHAHMSSRREALKKAPAPSSIFPIMA
jgi:hypothetical protein